MCIFVFVQLEDEDVNQHLIHTVYSEDLKYWSQKRHKPSAGLKKIKNMATRKMLHCPWCDPPYLVDAGAHGDWIGCPHERWRLHLSALHHAWSLCSYNQSLHSPSCRYPSSAYSTSTRKNIQPHFHSLQCGQGRNPTDSVVSWEESLQLPCTAGQRLGRQQLPQLHHVLNAMLHPAAIHSSGSSLGRSL